MGIGADSNALLNLTCLNWKRTGGLFLLPVRPAVHLNSGRDKNEKNLERQQEAIQKYSKEHATSDRYNREFLLRVTKIPEDKVDELIAFCDLKADVIEKVNDYDLIVLTKNCYKHYMEEHPEVKPRANP